MIRREGLTPFCDFQLLTPLSTQQVETPLALRHGGRAEMLTHLAEEIEVQTVKTEEENSIFSLMLYNFPLPHSEKDHIYALQFL